MTALGDGAQLDEYKGDLRTVRGDDLAKRLRSFPKIFCREAQAVWSELRPYLDKKTLDGARKIGLPADQGELAKRAGDDVHRLAAALVRVSLDEKLAEAVRAA